MTYNYLIPLSLQTLLIRTLQTNANIGKNLAAEIERNITNDGDYRQYLTTPGLTKCKI